MLGQCDGWHFNSFVLSLFFDTYPFKLFQKLGRERAIEKSLYVYREYLETKRDFSFSLKPTSLVILWNFRWIYFIQISKMTNLHGRYPAFCHSLAKNEKSVILKYRPLPTFWEFLEELRNTIRIRSCWKITLQLSPIQMGTRWENMYLDIYVSSKLDVWYRLKFCKILI